MFSPYYWTKMIKFECVTVDERSLRYLLLLLLLCKVDWRLVFFLLTDQCSKKGRGASKKAITIKNHLQTNTTLSDYKNSN